MRASSRRSPGAAALGLLSITLGTLGGSGGCIKHECEDHPERCGERSIAVLSGPLSQRGGISTLRFEIRNLSPLLPPEAIAVRLVQGEVSIPLTVYREADSTVFAARLSSADLRAFHSGRARLAVTADSDSGQGELWIVPRVLYFDARNELQFSNLPATLTSPKPVSMSIEPGNLMLVLSAGISNSTGKNVRKLNEYAYQLDKLTPSGRAANFLDDLDPAAEVATSTESLLITQPDGTASDRLTLRVCSVSQPLLPCGNKVVMGLSQPHGLTVHPSANAFAVLTSGAISMFQYSVDQTAMPPSLTLESAQLVRTFANRDIAATALGTFGSKRGAELVALPKPPAATTVLTQLGEPPPLSLGVDELRSARLGAALAGVAGSSGTGPDALAAGDLDGDGRTDLLLAYGAQVTALLGLDDGEYRKIELPPSLLQAGDKAVRALAIGSLDSDGTPDVVVLRDSGTLSVHKNPLEPIEHPQQ